MSDSNDNRSDFERIGAAALAAMTTGSQHAANLAAPARNPIARENDRYEASKNGYTSVLPNGNLWPWG